MIINLVESQLKSFKIIALISQSTEEATEIFGEFKLI